MIEDSKLWLTKKRLTEWGNWCYQIITMGLGYSRESLLVKMERNGGLIIPSTAKMLVPTNERAEEVNTLIEQLATDQPDGEGKQGWATVIRIHYTMRDKNNKMKIHASQFNERTYYRYLRDAHKWLSLYLGI